MSASEATAVLGRLDDMEGFNPERALRLQANPQQPLLVGPQLPARPGIVEPESWLPPPPPLPRVTGANTTALGKAPDSEENSGHSHQGFSVKLENPHTLRITRSVAPPGLKRKSVYVDEKAEKRRPLHDKQVEYLEPVVFQSAPAPNPHTKYLESLLHSHPFQLTIELRASKNVVPSSATYQRSITNAGILMNELIQVQVKLPMMRLPTLSRLSGGIDRTISGQLLEDIWFELTPTAKYSYARQLRKIVNSMRDSNGGGKKRQLGSLRAGPFTLMLDKHSRGTYWAVRSQPTDRQFVAFLLSSFYSTVPTAVATTLAYQFKPSYSLMLSHGELSPKNIVVENSKIVCILGWDCAGWYPEWWEYVKFFEARTRGENQDWYECAKDIFEVQYPTELAAYQGVVRCQKP